MCRGSDCSRCISVLVFSTIRVICLVIDLGIAYIHNLNLSTYTNATKAYLSGNYSEIKGRADHVSYCVMSKAWSKQSLDSQLKSQRIMLLVVLIGCAGSCLLFLGLLLVKLKTVICPPPKLDPKIKPLVHDKRPDRWGTAHTVLFTLLLMTDDGIMSAVGAVVFSSAQGSDGILCLVCQLDQNCLEDSYFDQLYTNSILIMRVRVIYACAVVFVHTASGFFAWTKTGKFDFIILRGFTTIFFGLFCVLFFTTPAMLVLKYGYYAADGVKTDTVASIIDSAMMIGVLLWGVVLIVLFCKPLVSRLAHSEPVAKKK